MSITSRYRNGELTKSELRAMAKSNPGINAEIQSLLNEEMSEAELYGIAAAGTGGKDEGVTIPVGDYGLLDTVIVPAIEGSDGDDTLTGSSGSDIIHGEGGNDVLRGGGGDDYVSGGDGNDYVAGDAGDDHVTGGDGNDIVRGEDGNDYVVGGDGDDAIDGGEDDDTLDGGTGDDFIMGGAGDDILTGGEGNDVFAYQLGDGDDIITDFTSGEDQIKLYGMSSDDYTITYDAESGNSLIQFEGGSILVEGVHITDDDIYGTDRES